MLKPGHNQANIILRLAKARWFFVLWLPLLLNKLIVVLKTCLWHHFFMLRGCKTLLNTYWYTTVMWNWFRHHLERLPVRQQEQATRMLTPGNANVTSQTAAATADNQSSAAVKTSTGGSTSTSNTTPSSSRSRLLLSRSALRISLCIGCLCFVIGGCDWLVSEYHRHVTAVLTNSFWDAGHFCNLS